MALEIERQASSGNVTPMHRNATGQEGSRGKNSAAQYCDTLNAYPENLVLVHHIVRHMYFNCTNTPTFSNEHSNDHKNTVT